MITHDTAQRIIQLYQQIQAIKDALDFVELNPIFRHSSTESYSSEEDDEAIFKIAKKVANKNIKERESEIRDLSKS